jgi:putative membrane protein
MPIAEKTVQRAIVAGSVIIPLAVAVLLSPAFPKINLGFDTRLLPKLNAVINSSVALLLLSGLVFIKRRQIQGHRISMISAFALSCVFLVSYVLYHLSAGHTPYCEEGLVPRPVYFFTLISHIALSAFIVPLAGFTIKFAWFNQYPRHSKLAKVAWPLWFYVAVTGVLVYIFNAPCYA